jgi:hypothetical protein
MVALLPTLIVGGLLYWAASLTQSSFFFAEHSLAMAMEWLIVMLPFVALLTPSVVFFFNFSVESYHLLQPSARPLSR